MSFWRKLLGPRKETTASTVGSSGRRFVFTVGTVSSPVTIYGTQKLAKRTGECMSDCRRLAWIFDEFWRS